MGIIKKNRFNLHIRLKVLIVILITAVISIITYKFNNIVIKKYVLASEMVQQEEHKSLVRTVLEAQNEAIKKSIYDYGFYDWMAKFTISRDTIEAKEYISPPEFIGVDFFLVYNLQQERILCNKANQHSDLKINFDTPFFKELYSKKYLNFFEINNREVVQIVATTIHNTQDTARIQNPFGYLILVKVYDKNYLSKTEKIINCKLKFKEIGADGTIPSNMDILLKSYNNKVIGGITIIKESEIINNIKKLNHKLEWILISFILSLVLLTLIAYNLIVLKPLSTIQNALNHQSDKIARKLMYKRDEFGKIARLIVRFFEQRKLLDEKLEKLSVTKNELKTLNSELTITANNLRKANKEIKLQQKNTNDNIYYASAVQRAALIPSFDIENVFKDHFIIFKPRDIISGDFYWFHQYQGRYFVATADCTGHGLSGSLMSMLGISFLNQIVLQSDKDITAAEILKKLRSFIVDSLHQQGSNVEVHDGIDIGICIFNFENMTLEYAAAYNPLLLLRKNKETLKNDLIIYKGDSMPAGIYEIQNNFSNHVINLEPDDCLYLYTDGYVDQFGGPHDKKFLTKKLRELIVSIAHLPLKNQKEILLKDFDEWKGHHFQVDDVTMIGLKIGKPKIIS
jgi:serine phosphatase RsbU (regulator of sigma subunit)